MITFLTRPLSRRTYALLGFGLMIFKYICEATLISYFGGGFYSPVAFLLPLISSKSAALQGTGSQLGVFLVVWSLPFVFVALVFSIRRCIDASINPWAAFWVLCPVLNLLVMLGLCLLPSRFAPQLTVALPPTPSHRAVFDSMIAVLIGLALGATMLSLGVYILRDYSTALFFVTPILMGAVSSYHLAVARPTKIGEALGIASLCVTLGLAMMLLFALEGVVCIAMAAPIGYAGGGIGSVLGYAIAVSSSVHKRHWGAAVLLLPTVSLLENFYSAPQVCVVNTAVEIDAPCQQVWQEVITFAPISSVPTGWFRWGIAYPIRARIEGYGVGATRYCEFSTGSFEEPITAWEEPHRLTFNVTRQPAPLTELSPYRHVHAPHLDGFLSTQRGEFQLTELPGNRTRLEGRTWYTNEMYPQLYWRIWSDNIIHSVHMRVLSHIREQAQRRAVELQASIPTVLKPSQNHLADTFAEYTHETKAYRKPQ